MLMRSGLSNGISANSGVWIIDAISLMLFAVIFLKPCALRKSPDAYVSTISIESINSSCFWDGIWTVWTVITKEFSISPPSQLSTMVPVSNEDDSVNLVEMSPITPT